jgi:hypothetical protein
MPTTTGDSSPAGSCPSIWTTRTIALPFSTSGVQRDRSSRLHRVLFSHNKQVPVFRWFLTPRRLVELKRIADRIAQVGRRALSASDAPSSISERVTVYVTRVESDDRMLPPIHAEYLLSDGATTAGIAENSSKRAQGPGVSVREHMVIAVTPPEFGQSSRCASIPFAIRAKRGRDAKPRSLSSGSCSKSCSERPSRAERLRHQQTKGAPEALTSRAVFRHMLLHKPTTTPR